MSSMIIFICALVSLVSLRRTCHVVVMNKQWKKTKRTGGVKRKIKTEYSNFISGLSNEKRVPNNDTLDTQNTEQSVVVHEPSTSQEIPSSGSVVHSRFENENYFAEVLSEGTTFYKYVYIK